MPTVLIIGKYRFFFNSREELRMYRHVNTSDGTAKFWLEPLVGLANYYNISTQELKEMQQLTEEHKDEFTKAWRQHFNQ